MRKWKYIRYDIEDRWRRLGLRKCIDNNPKIVVGISVAVIFIFLLTFIVRLMPYRPLIDLQNSKAWFYDLNTDELFIADGDEIAPIKAPSGDLSDGEPAGVKG